MLSGLTNIIKRPLFLQSHKNISYQVMILKIKNFHFIVGVDVNSRGTILVQYLDIT